MDTQAAFYALVATVVASVPILMMAFRRGLTTAGEQTVRQAKQAGRVVVATLKKRKFLSGDPSGDLYQRRNLYLVVYEYQVDGISYTYRARLRCEPPQTLMLYYPEGRPNKAVLESDRTPGVVYSLASLFPLALWVAFYYLVFQ